jgi:hypothetical protein
VETMSVLVRELLAERLGEAPADFHAPLKGK